MPVTSKTSDKHYYSQYPTGRHQTGDIWFNIPTLGLLPKWPTCSAIVVTPACDLQNGKTDTIVMIPIVPLSHTITLPQFIRHLSNELKGMVTGIIPELRNSWDLCNADFRAYARDTAMRHVCGQTQKESLNRFVELISFCESTEQRQSLGMAFISPARRMDFLRKIVTNAFSSDLHFFPRERESDEFQTIAEHSVGLLRYIISYPVEILDDAQMATELSWKQKCQGFCDLYRVAFQDALPIRSSRLNQSVLVDLITRLTSLFNRIGSEDFTPACVDTFIEEF